MATIQTQGFTLDNSGKRIVVDPITRIEGHLRIEVNVDKDNVIRNAVSTGTMWRGLEDDPERAAIRATRGHSSSASVACAPACTRSLGARGRGRARASRFRRNANHDPQPDARDAVCTGPPRPLLPPATRSTGWTWSPALKADPKKTSGNPAKHLEPTRIPRPRIFRDVQNRLKKFVESGQLGIFANAYWGNPAYKLAAGSEPARDDALSGGAGLPEGRSSRSRRSSAGRIHTPTGLVGGVPSPINVDGTGAVGAVNMAYLNMVGDICNRTNEFIDQVYIPDLLAIAGFYKDWAKVGGGLSGKNVLAYGEFPRSRTITRTRASRCRRV